MRVLQIIDCISRLGGLERFAERFSRDLLARGHETVILEVRPEAGRQPASLDGITIDRPADPVACAARWKPDAILSHQAGDGRLLRQLAAGHFLADLVQRQLCPSAKLFRRGDRVCDHPMGPRCLLDWYAGPCGGTRSPLRALRVLRESSDRLAGMHHAHLVLVASAYMHRHVLGEGIDPGRVRIVDISDEVPPPAPIQYRTRSPEEPVKLLYVGRVVYEKGVQYAIRALQHLPAPYTLRVVGDGWHRPALERLARELGLETRVTFSGTLDAAGTKAAYAAADVLVAPSVWPEPAGLIVPEGRAAGLPVVVFDRGGLVEWATGGRVDELTAAHDVTPLALAEAVLESLKPGGARVPAPAAGPSDPRLRRWRMLDALLDAFEGRTFVKSR